MSKNMIDEVINFRLDPDSNAYEAQIGYEEAEALVDTVVQECIDECRKLWYSENNKSTEGMDARSVGIHVGIKSGLIQAMNALSKLKSPALPDKN